MNTQNNSNTENFWTSLWYIPINLAEYNITLTPTWLATICDSISYLLFIFSCLIYWTLLNIIIKNSTPEMKLYKWYILWHSLMVFGYECCISFLRLEVFFPYPMITVGGFAKYFSLGPINYFLGDGFFFLMICCFYTTTILFVFRFLQMSKSGFQNYFNKWKFSIPGHCFMLCAAAVSIILPLHLAYEPEENLRKLLQIYNKDLYEHIKDRILFGMLHFGLITLYILIFWVCGAVLIILSCTFLIYLQFHKKVKKFSKKTYKLYRSLIKALVIETLFGGLLICFPLLALALGFIFKLPCSPIISTISLMISNFYPIASHVVTLIYIGPYRRALKEKMKKNKWLKKLFNNVQPEENNRRIFVLTISHISSKS